MPLVQPWPPYLRACVRTETKEKHHASKRRSVTGIKYRFDLNHIKKTFKRKFGKKCFTRHRGCPSPVVKHDGPFQKASGFAKAVKHTEREKGMKLKNKPRTHETKVKMHFKSLGIGTNPNPNAFLLKHRVFRVLKHGFKGFIQEPDEVKVSRPDLRTGVCLILT